MSTDYQGNSKKEREAKVRPEKPALERVVKGRVLVQKKPIGRKIKDLFIEADFRTVTQHVIAEVLLPSLKNMIVDGAIQGVQRMMYGEAAVRRRPGIFNGNSGTRVTYQTPPSRAYRDTTGRVVPSGGPPPDPRSSQARENFILSTREEADLVVERMNDILDQYEIVSVAELYELCGLPVNPIDSKWGWAVLGNVPIHQVREGYLIDFPPAEPLN